MPLPWFQNGVLRVMVLEAKELHSTATVGIEDPYVVLRVGAQTLTTQPDSNGGVTPCWDEMLQFNLQDPALSLESDCMYVEIWDKNVVRDRLMGRVELPLVELVCTTTEQTKWYRLNRHQAPRRNYVGFLLLQTQYYPPMSLVLHRARNLYNTVWFGQQSPFVRVRVGKRSYDGQTAAGGGQDPVWSEEFFINPDVRHARSLAPAQRPAALAAVPSDVERCTTPKHRRPAMEQWERRLEEAEARAVEAAVLAASDARNVFETFANSTGDAARAQEAEASGDDGALPAVRHVAPLYLDITVYASSSLLLPHTFVGKALVPFAALVENDGRPMWFRLGRDANQRTPAGELLLSLHVNEYTYAAAPAAAAAYRPNVAPEVVTIHEPVVYRSVSRASRLDAGEAERKMHGAAEGGGARPGSGGGGGGGGGGGDGGGEEEAEAKYGAEELEMASVGPDAVSEEALSARSLQERLLEIARYAQSQPLLPLQPAKDAAALAAAAAEGAALSPRPSVAVAVAPLPDA
jgi:uncharacterized membrane protein YgcG